MILRVFSAVSSTTLRSAVAVLMFSFVYPLCAQLQNTDRAVVASYLRFAPVFDTVYVQGDRYAVVSLAEQMVHVHMRSGSVVSFPVSSGNKGVAKGIATPTGIYSVQSKYREAVSKQFNNAKMYWWVGFHYNVGFHGLDGTSYHRFLGKRPSSHGCLRMAKSDAEQLHTLLQLGTPVMVYDSVPARVLAFLPKRITDSTHSSTEIASGNSVPLDAIRLPSLLDSRTTKQERMMQVRLQNLYAGKHFISNQRTILMAGQPLRPGGYDIGSALALPAEQKRVFYPIFAKPSTRDNTKQWQRSMFVHSDSSTIPTQVDRKSTHSHHNNRKKPEKDM